MSVIELRILGSLSLVGPDGEPVRSILTQPKRLAFLTYLTLRSSEGFVRRDELLGVFWPDSPEERARHSLSQALYVLKQKLGEELIETRGEDEVRVSSTALWCDAVAFEDGLEEESLERALELHRGEMLEGVFISRTPEFEQWVGNRRREIRRKAAEAAEALSRAAEDRADMQRAIRWCRRAVALEPMGEASQRKLMILLDQVGDRGGAVQAYESFATRLREEYELEPSPETQALVDAIRERGDVRGGNVEAQPLPTSITPGRSREPMPAPAGPPMGTLEGGHPGLRRRLGWTAGAALAVAGLAGLALSGVAGSGRDAAIDHGPGDRMHRALVLPLENRTGDPELDALGGLTAEWISSELLRTGLLEVAPQLLVRWSERERSGTDAPLGPMALAERAGATLLVTGSFDRLGDSVIFRAQLTDAREGALLRSVQAVGSGDRSPIEAVRRLRDRIVGAMGTALNAQMSQWMTVASQPPSAEGYGWYADGLDAFMEGDYDTAIKYLYRAGDDTPPFHAPLIWAVWAHVTLGRWSTADSLVQVLRSRRELMASWDRAAVDNVAAYIEGDYHEAYRAARSMVRLAPHSEWWYKAALAAFRAGLYRETLDALDQIDLDGGWMIHPLWHREYWELRSESLHQLGEYEAQLSALRRARRDSSRDDLYPGIRELKAFVAMGQIDAAWTGLRVLDAREEARGRPERGIGWRSGLVMALGVHGYEAESRRMAGDLVERLEPFRNEPWHDWFEAWALAHQGPDAYERAERLHRELLTEGARDPKALADLRQSLGKLLARKGDRPGALEQARLLAEEARPEDRGGAAIRRAEIHAVLGDRERALELIDEALSRGLQHNHIHVLYPDAALVLESG